LEDAAKRRRYNQIAAMDASGSAFGGRMTVAGAVPAIERCSVMRPEATQTAISISARDCPVCGKPVHWSRYWLRAWAWAKWPCPRCGSLLGFDRKRRWLIAIPAGLSGGMYGLIQSRCSALVALPVLVLGSAALGLLDQVTVVGHRNPGYCRSCRYDLTGTLSAGIVRCPECGADVPTEQTAATRPVA
jgi:endogenous inhibitor of DNA gyrase (YacG/DUF329 family)